MSDPDSILPVLPSLETWVSLFLPDRIAFFWTPTLAGWVIVLFLVASVPLLAIHYVGKRATVWMLIGLLAVSFPVYYTGKAINTWWSYFTEGEHKEWRKANLALAESKSYISAEEYGVRQRMISAITHAGAFYANFYQDSGLQVNAYAQIPDTFRERDKELFEIEGLYQKNAISWWEYRHRIDELNEDDGPVKIIGTGYIPAQAPKLIGYTIFLVSILLLVVGNGGLTLNNFSPVRQARWRRQRVELEKALAGLDSVQTVNSQKSGSYSGPYRVAWPYLFIRDVKMVLADAEWDPDRERHLVLVTGVVLRFFRGVPDKGPAPRPQSIFARGES